MAGKNSNALAQRVDPVRYVDRAQSLASSGNMHPRVEQDMAPMMDTMERSQQMRGARDYNGVSPQQQGMGDPVTFLKQKAEQLGYRGNDPGEAMRMIWDAEPTDSVAEAIDMVTKKMGIPPPWAGAQQAPKPPPGGGGAPPYKDPYEPY